MSFNRVQNLLYRVLTCLFPGLRHKRPRLGCIDDSGCWHSKIAESFSCISKAHLALISRTVMLLSVVLFKLLFPASFF